MAGFRDDAFNLNFNELYKNYPMRRVPIFRYKVKNFNDTLRKIIINPKRNVLFLLEDETEIKAVQDNYQGTKQPVTIGSGQAAGAAEGVTSETITMISGDLLPADYRNEFYIYTFNKVAPKDLSSEEIFVDAIGASVFPDLQETLFKGAKDQNEKVTNVMSLTKLSLKATGNNFNLYSYYWDDILYFDGNASISLKLPGLLGEFGARYLDNQKHTRQLEYILLEDAAHKYATLQAQPTRLRPELVLSSDTYDKNKNLSFDLAREFIGKQTKISAIWSRFGFSKIGNTDTTAAAKLYWAFLTIVFLANQRLTEFKDYRIADQSSPNLGKIDTAKDGLASALYGVAIDDILNIEQKEQTAKILKVWEQEFSDDLEDKDNALNSLYQAVKGCLAALTEYIPSPYAFGTYNKIGRLALEWYFTPEKMNITIADLKARVAFNVKLDSVKFDFNTSTKQIAGLSESYRKISVVRNFNLDGQVTLPSIPEVFTEENKLSTAGAADVTNLNFLKYTWVFQLKDKSKYAQLYAQDNPFLISGKNGNSSTKRFADATPFSKGDLNQNIPSPLNEITRDAGPVVANRKSREFGVITGTFGTFKETDYPGLENYLQNEVLINGRKITPGSATVKVTYTTAFIQGISTFFGRGDTGATYTFAFTWEEFVDNIKVSPIKPPFSIDQAQWETFESALGSTESQFILKPQIQQKVSEERRLSDIYWKSALANFAIIRLKAVKKDGTKEDVDLQFDLGFKKDQAQVTEGLYV